MKATYKTRDGRLSVEIEGDDQRIGFDVSQSTG